MYDSSETEPKGAKVGVKAASIRWTKYGMMGGHGGNSKNGNTVGTI